jgi:hypothetical protein
MKKRQGLFFGFAVLAVLAAAAIFALAGCDTGGDAPEGDGGIPGTRAFSVSGSFDRSGNNGDVVYFELQSNAASPSASVMRSVTAESYTLSGVLEDGNLTIRLKGSYDPHTGNWSVSAKSPTIIYTLDGSVDSAGVSQGASATIAVKNGNEWVPYTVLITEGASHDFTNDATEAMDSEEGVPSSVQGYWYMNETFSYGSASHSLLVSDWKMQLIDVLTTPEGTLSYNQSWTILDWKGAGPSYEMTYCYIQYVMTPENLAKAMAAYLDLDERDITALNANPRSGGNLSEGRWVYVDEDSTYQGGFSPEESQKLDVFWQTGGWEIWVMLNGGNADKKNKYVKDKISFNNTTLSITPMVAGDGTVYTRAFDSLEALTNATMVEEHVWVNDEGENPIDSGVFYTITFTR